ncbi:MAG: signal peptidase I [Acutalibacteraceae bacterium]
MNNDERITDITADEAVTEVNNNSKKKDGKKGSFYLSAYDFVSIIMTSFIIIAVVFTFLFRLVGVEGFSMTNTLQDNDWLLTVQKDSYERGDIVVITQPNFFNEPLIKRVIATGGETVDIDFDTGTVYVDGVALEEPYTREDYILPKLDDINFPYTVPEGEIFCMGDNRNGSTDSRSVRIGSFDERYVLGKAVVRVLPVGDFSIYDYE